MPRCGFTKEDGRPCERIISASQTFCYSHDPAREEQRRRNAKKAGRRGGKGRPLTELKALRVENGTLRQRMLEGELNPRLVAVAIQSVNVDIRCLEAELKAREQEELEDRMEAIEEALQARRGYGA